MEPEIDEHTRRMIKRVATFDEGRKTAVDTKRALERVGRSIQQHPAPR